MATTEACLGLWSNYVTAESGWTNQFNANMDMLGVLTQLSVKSRTLTAPPGSPANGDRYLPATGASGAWVGKAGYIAVYRAGPTGWEFYAPKQGWLCVIEAESKLSTYLAGAWTAGIAL